MFETSLPLVHSLSERTRSCSADFSLVTTETPGHNYFFLPALRKVSASLEAVITDWACWVEDLCFLLSWYKELWDATKHTLFSILNCPFCWAIGQKWSKTEMINVLFCEDRTFLACFSQWAEVAHQTMILAGKLAKQNGAQQTWQAVCLVDCQAVGTGKREVCMLTIRLLALPAWKHYQLH